MTRNGGVSSIEVELGCWMDEKVLTALGHALLRRLTSHNEIGIQQETSRGSCLTKHETYKEPKKKNLGEGLYLQKKIENNLS